MGGILINNLSSNLNHAIRLRQLLELSDDILIVSPFLMSEFSNFFQKVNLEGITKIHLITTLPPFAYEQIQKIDALFSFIELPYIKSRAIESEVSINNKLHGKVYVFKKSGEYIAAIISSANFTVSGLSRNHEWGIELNDAAQIAELANSVIGSIEINSVSFEEIHQMKNEANQFQLGSSIQEMPIDLSLIDLLSRANWVNQLDDTINYWLKPIGVASNPVPHDRLFNEVNQRLHFSKKRPSGVKPNDILIAYGVGSTKVLSIYRATSSAIISTEDEIVDDDWLERWPWYVESLNLTPVFGAKWADHELFIGNLVHNYLTENTDRIITAAGSRGLGALNYGQDKIKLNPEFARYIIDEVVAING